ncbi:MAG: DinB family protein [Candidatus Zixiibacteriota bacterium]
MFKTIAEFEQDWGHESSETQKMMNALTDASLSQSVAKDHRTLGRMAWHITTTYAEMMSQTGMKFTSVDPEAPVPKTAAEIQKAYAAVTKELGDNLKRHWADASLETEDTMYGAYKWKRSFTLSVLIRHEIHHRGQMTVLMRQAGLKVPGVYGPSMEEWAGRGMNPPTV